MKSLPNFWEKTVEYAFVIEAANNKRIALALPLSGTIERMAGDAIFGADARLVLIEFKRGVGQVNSELEIFTDYQGAKSSLEARDQHHFLVYPIQRGNPTDTPVLIAETYFSRKRCEHSHQCLGKGVEPSVFQEYLATLFTFKVPDGRSSGGRGEADVFAHVLGVSEDGKLVHATSLQDYVAEVFPDAVVEREIAGETLRPRSGPK